jgi:hypothetical protein
MRSVFASRRMVFWALLACGTLVLSISTRTRGFTAFAPTTLPQRAIGDFDGDGRVDVARIQHDARGSSIVVQLSDAAHTAHLDANVNAVVERDVDRDGDLDLIATTPTGDVLIWINDGHGAFTRQDVSRTSHLATQARLVPSGPTRSAAITVHKLVLSDASVRRHRRVAVTRIRPPTVDSAASSTSGLLPPFRAPPTTLS